MVRHTAATRAAEQRARGELAARGIDPGPAATTADQWLDAHRAEQVVEDVHREITDEVELADVVEQREADISAVELQPSIDAAETVVGDVREHATAGSSGREGQG